MERYFDVNGKPISFEEFILQCDQMDSNYSKAELSNGFQVCTVLLGINCGTEEEPLIFESIVKNNLDREIDCRRYRTHEQATVGHKELIEKWETAKREPGLPQASLRIEHLKSCELLVRAQTL